MLSSRLIPKLFQRTFKNAPKMARITLKPTLANTYLSEEISYADELSRHRTHLPLYDLYPFSENNYIAPSSTLVGEVFIDSYATIWNNVVIRGDINAVYVGGYSSIGENTVIQTVASLPTGQEAAVFIGNNVTIHSDCTLSS